VTAIEIYNSLGKRSKLALAARDQREIRDIFCDIDGERIYDTVVTNRVLQLCDRYASKVKK
jgi:hypothetical protein